MATVAAVTGGLFTSRARTEVTAGTHYISGLTDLSKAVILIEGVATAATAVVTLKAGTGYSAIGQGDYSFTLGTAAATNGTVVISGASFESARFLGSNGYIQLLLATGADVYLSAVQNPAN